MPRLPLRYRFRLRPRFRSRSRSRFGRGGFLRPKVLGYGLLGLMAIFAVYVGYLDWTIRAQFEGKRWALPARVYASPTELYPGKRLTTAQFSEELVELGYRYGNIDAPGNFQRARDSFEVMARPFVFWDGPQAGTKFRISFDDDRVSALEDLATGQDLPLLRLDPLLIGGIYPTHNEDRVLVKLNDAPPVLLKALIAIEDRKFYTHHGVDPRGLLRALFVNLRAANTVQGGSTLTQQLVKNFYLTAERSLRRKLTEMIMAVLLDAHYAKDEILEAYLNEIYLGQDGSRAIHGFGLAAQYYFDRPLKELTTSQAALLVGLVKGPAFYGPRRHPERALTRRNLVLGELAAQGVITKAEHLKAKAMPLQVAKKAPVGTSPYPAFLTLVHRQLRRDYSENDLRSEGLNIYTTLSPAAQRAAESALATRLPALEKHWRLPTGKLEGAVIVTSADSGEVHAIVGGRDARFEGFNRALDAERQVGSLIKPVLYLTALTRPDQYTLATLLDDSPLVFNEPGMVEWAPQNYDKTFHGPVDLRTALAQSYNVAAARLGIAVGVKHVIASAQRLGVERQLPPYASTVLGSINLTPFEVAQMYQTLASGGFRAPLRAIREVTTAQGEPLSRYGLAVEQTADPSAVFLLTTALQHAVRGGTGASLSTYIPDDVGIAGKTGTTNDLRDSWFAGYSGDKLAIVWIGRDDNQPSGLTGASGALTVFGETMRRLHPEPLTPAPPENIEFALVDIKSGLLAERTCADAVELPFIRGSAPTATAPCAGGAGVESVKGWFKGWFGR